MIRPLLRDNQIYNMLANAAGAAKVLIEVDWGYKVLRKLPETAYNLYEYLTKEDSPEFDAAIAKIQTPSHLGNNQPPESIFTFKNFDAIIATPLHKAYLFTMGEGAALFLEPTVGVVKDVRAITGSVLNQIGWTPPKSSSSSAQTNSPTFFDRTINEIQEIFSSLASNIPHLNISATVLLGAALAYKAYSAANVEDSEGNKAGFTSKSAIFYGVAAATALAASGALLSANVFTPAK